MQVETLTRICPLCRCAAEGEDAPLTRLCRNCRAMLDPILPRAGLIQPDYAVALACAPALQTAILASPLAHDRDFDDLSFAPAAGLGEDFTRLNEADDDDFDARPAANALAETTQQAFVQDVTPAAPEVSIAPDQYEDPEVFIAPDQYGEDDINSLTESAPQAAAIALPALSEHAYSAAEIEMAEAAPSGDLRADAVMPMLESHKAHVDLRPGDTNAHGLMAEAAAAPAASPADPWEDPLPAWEYSQNEWPLLVNKQEPSAASKLKWPLIGALVVIACAAAYFFFIKPHSEAPVAQSTPEASAQPPLTVPVDQPAPAAANATTSANSAATATDKQEAPPLASVNQTTDNQGKHALQAMASPNEGEANSFVERLKTAAIPAYVVRADLGSHGIWYRVRIGRFATPEEAQRFAVEARARARAVGVTLKDLQVTSYDKP
ncbi:MAG: hypothetical protein V7641_1537 [Blastocatellia bacterium]